MLLSCEALLEVRCIESHELAERLEADSVAYIFHAFLVGNDVVIQGLEAGYLCHKEVAIAWGLDYGVIKERQMVEGLDSR